MVAICQTTPSPSGTTSSASHLIMILAENDCCCHRSDLVVSSHPRRVALERQWKGMPNLPTSPILHRDFASQAPSLSQEAQAVINFARRTASWGPQSLLTVVHRCQIFVGFVAACWEMAQLPNPTCGCVWGSRSNQFRITSVLWQVSATFSLSPIG